MVLLQQFSPDSDSERILNIG